MDVKSAFLNGDLDEEVYIEQPDGFILGNDPKLVCRLKNALYGLKQAPSTWYFRLDKYLHQQGFSKGSTDNNLYIKIDNDKLLILVGYVDDIIFGSNEEDMSENFPLVMQKEFEMSLLGCIPSANDESEEVHQPTYRSMVGILLYLIGTRPNIMHVVGIVGRFQENPNENNLQEVKRILKYLQRTQNYGLWYPRSTDLTLHAYTDTDCVGSMDDRKSTSGGAFFMGPRLVSWFNKKQNSIALSIAKEKYVVAASCCTQLLWMMQTLQDLQITCTPPISIFCDNTSAISISKNTIMDSKTKHIPIKYHFLWEQFLEQNVKLEYVPSK
eukprot:PITA_35711